MSGDAAMLARLAVLCGCVHVTGSSIGRQCLDVAGHGMPLMPELRGQHSLGPAVCQIIISTNSGWGNESLLQPNLANNSNKRRLQCH